jgi:hypothetical protein
MLLQGQTRACGKHRLEPLDLIKLINTHLLIIAVLIDFECSTGFIEIRQLLVRARLLTHNSVKKDATMRWTNHHGLNRMRKFSWKKQGYKTNPKNEKLTGHTGTHARRNNTVTAS